MSELASHSPIFLSYAHADQAQVEELYQDLKRVGLNVWMDTHNILPGTLWKKAIVNSIRNSSFFLACISNKSVKKRGIIQVELKEALEVWREKLDDDIYIIPVRLEDCDVPDALAQFQWVDLYSQNGLQRLVETLKSRIEYLGIAQFMNGQVRDLENVSQDIVLQRYLDKVNSYKRPRLLVEGINTDNFRPHVTAPYGHYYFDINLRQGDTCIYFLELQWWQGTNGSEDVSDHTFDCIVFSKKDFLTAANTKAKSPYFQIRGDRFRDDGFWEDGFPNFKQTYLKGIPLRILVDIENQVFDLVHASEIEEHFHPPKVWIDDEQIIFTP